MLFENSEDDDFIEDSEPSFTLPEDEGLPAPRFAAEIYAHGAVEQQFLDMINAGKLPHAMIFSGLQGIGKATMAFRLAKCLLAAKPDAGPSLFGDPEPAIAATTLGVSQDSQSARLILSGGHPDLLVVERQYDESRNRLKDVDVDQVRGIPGFLHMTPFMGGWRIVIVDDADTMTRSGQNAILKILEEPPKNSLLIVIAHRPGLLIPTIRSRCRLIEFKAPERSDFNALMKKAMPAITTAEMEAVYNIASGSIGGALRLMQEGALKSLGRVTSLLSGWPEINWKEIHLMGEILGGKGQDDTALQGFQEILLWSLEEIVRAKAQGLPALPAPLNEGPFPRMMNHYSLMEWSKVCDNLRAHFATVKYGSLDRRQAVFGAFSILKSGEAA